MISVSVVIPTRNRPDTVERAVQSVLSQTFPDFEIVVVIDGADGKTEPTRLEALDTRVHVLTLEQNVGLAEARNEGIRAASGRWVALLDDDDEWLPEKLHYQVEEARRLAGEYVFVPCRFLEHTWKMERVMPNALPHTAENFSEYIYCDGGYLQPSMYFMSRKLALEVPFTKGLRHIEDSDWLLRMSRHPEVQVGAVERALSIYYNFKSGDRESETTPWQHPLHWAVKNHDLFTRRAFPFFVARLCVNARKAGEPLSVLGYLLNQARRYGQLSPRALSYFLAYWFLNDELLKAVRATAGRAMQLLRRPAILSPAADGGN